MDTVEKQSPMVGRRDSTMAEVLARTLGTVGLNFELEWLGHFPFAKFLLGDTPEKAISLACTIDGGMVAFMAHKILPARFSDELFWQLNSLNRRWLLGRAYHSELFDYVSLGIGLPLWKADSPEAVKNTIFEIYNVGTRIQKGLDITTLVERSSIRHPFGLDQAGAWLKRCDMQYECDPKQQALCLPFDIDGFEMMMEVRAISGHVRFTTYPVTARESPVDSRWFQPLQRLNERTPVGVLSVDPNSLAVRCDYALPVSHLPEDHDTLAPLVAYLAKACLGSTQIAHRFNRNLS